MSVPYGLPPYSMKRTMLVHTTQVRQSSKPKRYRFVFIYLVSTIIVSINLLANWTAVGASKALDVVQAVVG